MNKKVYMFRIEVKGLPGSKMPKNSTSAFVNCVVPGKNKNTADKLLKETLKEDKYRLINIDKIEDFYSLNFDENDSKDKEYIKMAEDAVKHGGVYYGVFNYW